MASLQVGQEIYVPEWVTGVFKMRVEKVSGACGIRLITLEGKASEFNEQYLLSGQERWKQRALAAQAKAQT